MSLFDFELLRHPLFISIFSIAISGIFLAEFSRRRDRRNEVLRQRIKFIDETVTLLNEAISNLFGDIVAGSKKTKEQTDTTISAAYHHRLRFELYSHALFQGTVDHRDFGQILHCINSVADEIRGLEFKSRTDHVRWREHLIARWEIGDLSQPMADELSGARKEQVLSVTVCMESSRRLLSLMLEQAV